MKDSSIGTYGALALGVVLLLKTAFLYELVDSRRLFLIFVPAAARSAQVAAIRIFKPARTEGFGFSFKNSVGTSDVLKAAAVSLVAGTALLGTAGAIITAFTYLWVILAGKWISRRLGGLNGDAYGALCELSELLILMLLVILNNTPFNLSTGWIEWLSLLL
jgi:adenosylcobinamide-GDP ribazoletransferase